MNERILEAISKLKKVQDELEVKLKTMQQNIDEKGSLNMQKALFTVADDLARYTIKDGNWYYNGKDTGVQAEAHDGEDGKQGPQGIPGRDGKNGKNGKDGKPGKNGKDGRPGRDGKDGKDGRPGRDGKDGKDGVIPELKIGKVEVSPEYGGAMAKLRPGKDNIMYLDLTLPRGPQGFTGFDGKDAKINGENTIEIKAGTNITINQENKTLTISSTGGGGSATWGNIGGTLSDQTDLNTALNEVNSIAKGANQAVGYNNYSAMTTALNAMDDEEYNVGQNVYIVTINVPDLWVSSVESTSSTYTYVDDATVVNDLETNGYIQVGYYKLSMLETQKVDLTNYVTNTDYATSQKGGVIKCFNSDGLNINNGTLIAATKTYAQYNSGGNWMFVGKGTLENVITGKGLVSNTDYASNNTGGVIKLNAGVNSSSGSIYANTTSYSSYQNQTNGYFIGKGTLENVLKGKGLNPIVELTQAQYDELETKDSNTYYYIVEE